MIETEGARSRPSRGAAKRARLIAAAERCFVDAGFRATTIAVIAEAARVPQGNVYYYFKSKDALAAAVVSAWRDAQETIEIDGPSRAALVAFVERELHKPVTLAARGAGRTLFLADLERAGSPVAADLHAYFGSVRRYVVSCVGATLDDDEREDRVPAIADWLLVQVAGVKAFIFTQSQPVRLADLRADLIARLDARLR